MAADEPAKSRSDSNKAAVTATTNAREDIAIPDAMIPYLTDTRGLVTVVTASGVHGNDPGLRRNMATTVHV